jgi:WD40 repeat protein
LEQVQFLPQTGAQDVAWSPDGHYLASASPTITQVWDTGSWKPVQPYEGAQGVIYSPDNRYLVLTQSVPYGNTGLSSRALFQVFDLKTDKHVGTISGDIYASGEAFFTGDGRYLISQSYCELPEACDQSGVFQIWDMRSTLPTDVNPEGPEIGDIYSEIAVTFGESQIAYIHSPEDSQESKIVTVLTPSTGQQINLSLPSGAFNIVSLGSNLGIMRRSDSQQVKIDVMNPETGVISQSFVVSYPMNFAISPVDEQIIAANYSNLVKLFSLQTSGLKPIRSMTLSFGVTLPDWVKQADLIAPQSSCAQINGAKPEAGCGIYSADGKFFAGLDSKYDSYVWDVSTGEGKRLFDVEPNDFARSFVFSDDSAKLAFSVADCLMGGRCTNSTLYVWDTSAQQLQSQTETDVITQIVFAPDKTDSLLAVVTEKSVSFYDSRLGQTIGSLPDFGASAIARLAFSNDGKLVLTRSYDNTIRVWGVKIYSQ